MDPVSLVCVTGCCCEAIHAAATRRGYQARALDKSFARSNDLTEPWGLMFLGLLG